METLAKTNDWTAEAALARCLRGISKPCRIAFLTAFALGLAVHAYNLTNLLPNHDSVLSLFTTGSTLASGRWFLPVLGGLGSTFTLRFVNGVLAVLGLSVTAALTVSLLEIRRPLSAALTAAALVTFPAVSNTLCYLFTADAYFFGTALAALGVWVTDRCPKRFWLGGLLLALATATYQVYLFFALALCAVRGLLLLLEGGRSDREIGRLIGRYALAFLIGAAVYAVGNAAALRLSGTVQTAYQGMGAGALSLRSLAAGVPKAYRTFFSFLFSETRELSSLALCAVHAGLLAGTAAMLLWLLLARKRTPLQNVLALGLTACLPLFLNTAFALPAQSLHILMRLPMALVYVLPVCLTERAALCTKAQTRMARCVLPRLMGWCVTAALLVASFGWSVYANKLYFQLQLKYENSFALANRIVDRIEQDPAYTPGMTVAFTGSLIQGNFIVSKERAYASLGYGVGGGGAYDYTLIHDEEHMPLFIQYFIGVQFGRISTEEVNALAGTDEVRAMSAYPLDGCIRRIGDVLVVKLGN